MKSRRFLSGILVLVMLLTMLPTTALATEDPSNEMAEESFLEVSENEPEETSEAQDTAAEAEPEPDVTLSSSSDEVTIVDQGYCGGEGDGTNLTWTLDSNGLLTISGKGRMKDYEALEFLDYTSIPVPTLSSAPWMEYKNVLTSLELTKGITSIGSYAFIDCSGFTGSLTIPNSVTSVGNWSFGFCSGFTGSLTIPDSVTSIGNWAFSECLGLDGSLTISDSVTSIGNFAFESCAFTGSLMIPDSVTSIGNWAFGGCSGFTGSLTIPNSVTSIGAHAFDTCYGFTGTLTILNGVTSIGSCAFNGCRGFTGSLTIPNSVTSIGEYAFCDCHGFTGSLRISDSVTSIGKGTFQNCSGFTGSLTIPNGVTSIGDYAFQNCSGFTGSLIIPSSVTYIGWLAFRDVGLTEVYFQGDAPYVAYSFNPTISLYYIAGKSGWTVPTWNGYTHIYTWREVISSPTISVPSGKYCIHVVDQNGNALSGAGVIFSDTAETLCETTDKNGNAYFYDLTFGTPLITVKLDGYTTWSNENSNWEKSANHYSTVVLYPDDQGDYKLAKALYSNSSSMSLSTNLLTTTKTLSLKNTGNWVGDLDFGEFYITCQANKTDDVASYELWQGSKKIEECTDGVFPKLSVTSFSKGGNCFIRVTTADGSNVDTNINLEFAENTINESSSIKIGEKISFKVADDVPYLGGSTVDIDFPMLPVDFEITETKIHIGFNAQVAGSDKGENKYDKLKETLEKVKKAKNGIVGASTFEELKKFQKEDKSVSLPAGGKFKVYVMGYAEGDLGSSTAKGELYLLLQAQTKKFGFNTAVVAVPVTVQVKATAEAKVGGTISYNWGTSQLDGGIDLSIKLGLEAFGGVGSAPVAGVGAYGSGEVEVTGELLGTQQGVDKVDLTGELGLKVYIAWFSHERPFAHNTWHLYTRNSVGLSSLTDDTGSYWADFYDASNYEVEDLSYLSEESDWLGDSVSLLDADANTSFSWLLTDTYRNAQPVMLQAGDTLYAAFLCSSSNNSNRISVWITRFNGSGWDLPVQVDSKEVLDDDPALCVGSDGTIWLAYASTASSANTNDLLSYAQNQSIVVGTIDPDTLKFTKQAVYSGTGYAHMQQLAVVDGTPTLVWADSAVTDANSVLFPQSSTIYAATWNGTSWQKTTLTTVNRPIWELTVGERSGTLAVAYLQDEDGSASTTDDWNLYRLSNGSTVKLADGITGNVRFGTLPGTTTADFLWNDTDTLCSTGSSVEVSGITSEYAVVGNRIYYSTATSDSANLAVVQYENGQWSLPIQLTDGERYLENLSVATLNGTDYVMGMHTLATIGDSSVTTKKNFVWATVQPVSDLRLEDAYYDADAVSAGDEVPVTLTVTNAGDHTVNSVTVTLDGQVLHTEKLTLRPGESTELVVSLTCPSQMTSYTLSVYETKLSDDFTQADNSQTVALGYTDVSVDLVYQQIGTSKALVATVTNQGVEDASGTLSFYDASGNLVATSEFENLAAGDMTVAIYSLEQDFDGRNGGDVSVSVAVDQEELYTYNNEATLHINEVYAVTAISSATRSGSTVNASIYCEEDTQGTAYCAGYSAEGKMLSVSSQPLVAGKQNDLTFTLERTDVSTVKIFVLDAQNAPLCAKKTLS